MIGDEVAQFGSCTFTPKTGKTTMQVVELVPCARNKWGNWNEFWFYVAEGTIQILSADGSGCVVGPVQSTTKSART
jgi:hypothetical protein